MTTTTPGALHHRIRALLAKAASTEYPEEAEALAAKAHELMERHAIDEAALQRTDPSRRGGAVLSEDRLVPGPYASARTALLAAIAHSAHCRMVIRGRVGPDVACTLVGRAGDLEYVRALHLVLDAQASRAMLAASDPTGRTRAFRHAFLLSYATRIAQRLEAARDAARSAVDERAQTSVALASADRWAVVDDEVRAQFPRLGTARRSASSGAGLASGRAAADRAALGHRPLGTRPALPGAR